MDDNYNSIELNMNIFVYSNLEIKLSQTVLLRKKLSEIMTIIKRFSTCIDARIWSTPEI